MKIVLTGATGFVGGHLYRSLLHHDVHVIGRSKPSETLDSHFFQALIEKNIDFSNVLLSTDILIHCAARAHVMKDEEADPLHTYREVNTAGTLNLAHQAALAGVKRFIFISSIKVNGETTNSSSPFSEQDLPAPQDPYGVSKMEAEAGLRLIAEETGMEVVIIRPPLVYGPGVKANFLSLIKLARMKIPLPFGGIKNARSMIYVDNLVDFIICCIDNPAAKNQTFLISDGKDLSLSDLLILMRRAMGKSPSLFPVPIILFKIAGAVTGKRAFVERLFGSLQVDSTKAHELLGWKPPYTVEQGIQNTIDSFCESNK
ncbi:MAG: SDR family oxidoreductase [Cellvibrionaceae bacterium]